jgi:hypothetical protein
MREFTINCPHCGVLLNASEEHLGLSLQCPSCDGSIQVAEPQAPATPEPRVKQVPTSPPLPSSKKKIVFRKTSKHSQTARTAPSRSKKTKACPFCGEEILAVAVKCKHCGSVLNAKRKSKAAAPQKPKTSSTAQGCGCLMLIVLGIIIFSSVSDCGGPSSSSRTPPKPKTQEELRTERLEGGFSAWDGSHRGLTSLIKKTMNDPKSYEHVETTYGDKGDHLIVKTTFRGKNAFGGVVANWVMAKTDLDGNVIEVIAQGP